MALTQKGDSQKMTESRGTAAQSKSSVGTYENDVERKQAWLNSEELGPEGTRRSQKARLGCAVLCTAFSH